MRVFRIGSRESRLAVAQAEIVINYIRGSAPEIRPELVTMKTTGDRILDRPLDQIGGKGLFVRELDRALMDGRTDLSVHSLKDLPMDVPEELPFIGFSEREDPRDALVLPEGVSVWDRRKPVGCGSRRRMVQLARLYPEVMFSPVRGNVQTRLKKLDSGEYGALILAAAGLKRLGIKRRISRIFTTEEMIPAAGQGILALQSRAGEDVSFLDGFCDGKAGDAALAERAFVRRLGGGCSSPSAAYAEISGENLKLTGLYYSEKQQDFITGSASGSREDAEALGASLADRLRGEMESAGEGGRV